jgi:hypothetical protein
MVPGGGARRQEELEKQNVPYKELKRIERVRKLARMFLSALNEAGPSLFRRSPSNPWRRCVGPC